jgi:hypothetical protein
MNYELIIWLTGLMLFVYWLIYVMGSPLADGKHRPDPTAILARLPRALAWRRLKKVGLSQELWDELQEDLKVTSGKKRTREAWHDWKLQVLETGRLFFTWERSLLCPICLHFWITVVFAAVVLSLDLLHARQDWLLAGFTYFVNHFFIRKIS